MFDTFLRLNREHFQLAVIIIDKNQYTSKNFTKWTYITSLPLNIFESTFDYLEIGWAAIVP